METIKQIDKQIEKLKAKREEILNKGTELKLGKKTFRIVKWENKPMKDFKYPKGWVLAEHSEFIELFDNKLINYPKEEWRYYWTKHFSKRKQNEKLLSRSYLDGNLYLNSYNDYLADSYSDGRVVLRKEAQKKQ